MTLIYKEMKSSENKITQIDINNTNENNGIRALLIIRYKTGLTFNPFILHAILFMTKSLSKISK
ncbi:hypothetical protein VCR29J2_700121 [Vibrio coralliirubri]|nr:hypothetical protein VCR29J2_700121 [Vibrio coralliirubri]